MKKRPGFPVFFYSIQSPTTQEGYNCSKYSDHRQSNNNKTHWEPRCRCRGCANREGWPDHWSGGSKSWQASWRDIHQKLGCQSWVNCRSYAWSRGRRRFDNRDWTIQIDQGDIYPANTSRHSWVSNLKPIAADTSPQRRDLLPNYKHTDNIVSLRSRP